jgi:hypothetical protein
LVEDQPSYGTIAHVVASYEFFIGEQCAKVRCIKQDAARAENGMTLLPGFKSRRSLDFDVMNGAVAMKHGPHEFHFPQESEAMGAIQRIVAVWCLTRRKQVIKASKLLGRVVFLWRRHQARTEERVIACIADSKKFAVWYVGVGVIGLVDDKGKLDFPGGNR